MKTLLLILLPLFSFAQNDEWKKYDELPTAVRVQVDSIHFKNALKIGDTLYLVTTKIKSRATDTQYKGDGLIMNVSEYNDSPLFGLILLSAVISLMCSLLIKL